MRYTFLITAGPTREYIDPVRYISNASSGKMGYAIASCARRRKHKVILVSGPVALDPPAGVTVRNVVTADEMFREVKRLLPASDAFISVAAVADYRPARRRHKIKKGSKKMSLELFPTRDILAYAGKRKGARVVVGFALESRRMIASAKAKMKRKNLDLIVANAPEAIGREASRCQLVDRTGHVQTLGYSDKNVVAEKIIDETLGILENR